MGNPVIEAGVFRNTGIDSGDKDRVAVVVGQRLALRPGGAVGLCTPVVAVSVLSHGAVMMAVAAVMMVIVAVLACAGDRRARVKMRKEAVAGRLAVGVGVAEAG